MARGRGSMALKGEAEGMCLGEPRGLCGTFQAGASTCGLWDGTEGAREQYSPTERVQEIPDHARSTGARGQGVGSMDGSAVYSLSCGGAAAGGSAMYIGRGRRAAA